MLAIRYDCMKTLGKGYMLGWYRNYNGDSGEGIMEICGEEGKGDISGCL